MRDLSAETFRQHLLEKYSLPARARARVESPANSTLTRPLRELWEATDLSAAEFADEVSDYWGVVRLGLPQLLASTPCLDGFSRRFLRESTIFPVRAPNGSYRLAVADPSDTAAIRAAEIVFGEPVEVAVASFEDITTVLDQRIEADDGATEQGAKGSSQCAARKPASASSGRSSALSTTASATAAMPRRPRQSSPRSSDLAAALDQRARVLDAAGLGAHAGEVGSTHIAK